MKVIKIFYIGASVVIVAVIMGILLGFEIVAGIGTLLWVAITTFVLSGGLIMLDSLDKGKEKPTHSGDTWTVDKYAYNQQHWIARDRVVKGSILPVRYYYQTAFPDEHCIVMEIKDKELIVKGLTTGQVYAMPYYAFIGSMV